MWSSIIEPMTQQYLEQSLLCMMSLYHYYSLGTQQRIVAPVMLAYLAVMPSLCLLVLYRNRAKLNQKAMR
jgi:hypothetical protein